MADEPPQIPNVPGGVPIIGQGARFMIGGLALSFGPVTPDQIAAGFQQSMESGAQLPHLFIMQWQRAAMHFQYHEERIAVLEKAVATLKKDNEQLRKDLAGEDDGTEGSN